MTDKSYKTCAAENAARKQDRKYPKPDDEDVVSELPELEPELEDEAEPEAESEPESEPESEDDE